MTPKVSRVPQRVSEKRPACSMRRSARSKTDAGAIIVFAALARATRRDSFRLLIGFEPDGRPASENAWRVAMPHDRPAICGSAREAPMNLEKDRSSLNAARVPGTILDAASWPKIRPLGPNVVPPDTRTSEYRGAEASPPPRKPSFSAQPDFFVWQPRSNS